MIRKIGQAFVLDTAHTTYAFSILPGGHPEHLYYGRTIHIEHPDDLEILVEKHVFAPGNVNICEKEHAGFSLEPIVRLVRKGVKHVLSHRVIYANFYEVILPENSASFAKYQRISVEDLHKFAVSRLVNQFFSLILEPNN